MRRVPLRPVSPRLGGCSGDRSPDCTRDRGRDSGRDSGVVIATFALGVSLLFALCALVIDLGRLHLEKERLQRASDLAALAAGEWLGNPGGRDPTEACDAALSLVESNLEIDEGALVVSGSGCDALGAVCTGVPAEVVATTETREITIRYPFTEDLLADYGELRAHDGSACERMEIRVESTVEMSFAHLMGIAEREVTATTVVRGVVGYSDVRVPALHSLRRFGCGAISVSGQGRIVVEAFDDDHPGVIGADSVGNTAGESACTANTNASGYVVFAQQWSGQPGIEARSTPKEPGVVGLVATKLGSTRDVCCLPTGVSPGSAGSPIISRNPMDWTYNAPARPAIDDLRSAAISATTSPLDEMRSDGWTVFPHDDATWSCQPNSNLVVSAEALVVDCPVLAPKSQAVITLTGSEIAIRGRLSTGTQSSVRMPRASRVYIAGSSAASGVDNSGTFSVNDGAAVGAEPRSCSTRAGDSDRPSTQIVVLAGGFTTSTSSRTNLCEALLYMAETDSPQQRTEGDTCAVDLPCPIVNSDRGSVVMRGSFDWLASNVVDDPPGALQPFEDLALWTESSLDSEISGLGTASTSGVFFLPNAHIAFAGQASQNVALNAQFFSESLDMSGQGTLRLMPNPNDVVPIPVANFYLIR